jgi:hypothetical protein
VLAARVVGCVRVLLAVVLVVACGEPMRPRQYPRWVTTVTDPAAIEWRGCAGIRTFVRKSGKQGIGLTVEVRTQTSCDVEVTRVELVLADGTRALGELPAARALRGRSLVYHWVPVRFDGDAAWNRGVRRGRLEIDLAIGGAAQPAIVYALVHGWDRS